MKRKRFLAIFVTCSILAMVLGTATTLADEPPLATIESFVVHDSDGTDVTEGPLMAGKSYKVYLTIMVGVELGNNTLILSTDLAQEVGGVYWHLENDYEGVDTGSWQPNLPQIEFNVVQGDAMFKLEGRIPSGYTKEELSNEEHLRFPKPISLVQLSLGPEGVQPLGERTLIVKDQAILDYEQTRNEKSLLLQEATTDPNEADPKYVKLVEDVIDRAEDLGERGYVEDAQALLDTIPDTASEFPILVSEESFLPYLIGIVVLAVILIVTVALFLRARANSSFIRQQVDEEAGRLDVLSVRISKIDKQLGEDIEQVKEELERIIGR